MLKDQIVKLLVFVLLSGCAYYEEKNLGGKDKDNGDEFNVADITDMEWLTRVVFQPKCGQCHSGSSAPGGFAFHAEDALPLALSKGGIRAGSSAGSLISQVIHNGRMPPPGAARLLTAEINVLDCWIDGGALSDSNACVLKFIATAAEQNPSNPTNEGETPLPWPVEPSPPLTPPEVLPEPASDLAWVSANLFQANCASCHFGTGPPAKLDFSTMLGIENAIAVGAIVPGNHAASMVHQEIAAGNMPPRHVPLRPTELAVKMLACWIDAGAKLDGKACWSTLVKPTNPSTPPSPPAEPPTELENNAFAAVNARVLQPFCVHCHNQNIAKGGVRLDRLATILNPVEGPRLVRCGRPSNSRIYKVLEDDEMPFRSDPLPADLKALVADWIAGGCQE